LEDMEDKQGESSRCGEERVKPLPNPPQGEGIKARE
jgi:hypothetical protein